MMSQQTESNESFNSQTLILKDKVLDASTNVQFLALPIENVVNGLPTNTAVSDTSASFVANGKAPMNKVKTKKGRYNTITSTANNNYSTIPQTR